MRGSLSVQQPFFLSRIGSSLKSLELHCGNLGDVVDIPLRGCLTYLHSLEEFVFIAEDEIDLSGKNSNNDSIRCGARERVMRGVMDALPYNLRCLVLDNLLEETVEYLADNILQL